jgi:hypothetical protein
MFKAPFQSKSSKVIVPEIQGSAGCAHVVIWNLECERHPTGTYRFVSDWGNKFVGWLNARWQAAGNQPLRILSNIPDEATVSISGYKDCRVSIRLEEYADEHQLFSDVLDAIIEGMKSIENKSK